MCGSQLAMAVSDRQLALTLLLITECLSNTHVHVQPGIEVLFDSPHHFCATLNF